MRKRCSSCNMDLSAVENSVVFQCPACGEAEIARCGSCRELSTKYTCPKCGFEGP